jgi:multisubunit Na+/H+ antiporter MnhG subunit
LFIGATVIAFPIGWAVTQAVLAVMFYLVLTPVAVVFRTRGRDELQLRRESKESSSFWIPRGDPPEPGRYLKQF